MVPIEWWYDGMWWGEFCVCTTYVYLICFFVWVVGILVSGLFVRQNVRIFNLLFIPSLLFVLNRKLFSDNFPLLKVARLFHDNPKNLKLMKPEAISSKDTGLVSQLVTIAISFLNTWEMGGNYPSQRQGKRMFSMARGVNLSY